MQRIKMEQKGRKTTIFEGVVNESKLYLDDDGYTVHMNEQVISKDWKHKKNWQMVLIRLLGRGYTAGEAYAEIRKKGLAPKGESTMYNFLRDFKAVTGLKFRVNEMTQEKVDKLRDHLTKSAVIPKDVSDKASEKIMKPDDYDIMLSKRERGGRPVKMDPKDTEHIKKHARILKRQKEKKQRIQNLTGDEKLFMENRQKKLRRR